MQRRGPVEMELQGRPGRADRSCDCGGSARSALASAGNDADRRPKRVLEERLLKAGRQLSLLRNNGCAEALQNVLFFPGKRGALVVLSLGCGKRCPSLVVPTGERACELVACLRRSWRVLSAIVQYGTRRQLSAPGKPTQGRCRAAPSRYRPCLAGRRPENREMP